MNSNMTIYKYEIKLTDAQRISMPLNAQIMSVQFQYNKLCLWAMVDPDATKHDRTIEIFGTGNPMDSWERIFIGTVQQAGGALVWHVFERL